MPPAYWGTVAFVFGAVIGSFLNVVIWRMPRGESLSHPGSHCPHCDRPLAAYENVPLLSFLALRARCRTCKAPISWRYFCVELLTACLFLVLYVRFGATVETVAYCLFGAALIAAFFIDLGHFIIPDEINTFALLMGIGLDAWLLATHAPGYGLLWGWLPRSIAGGALCAAIFVAIQVVGQALFHKDAMGDGDVKLARAIGAMLPLSQALVSFLLAIAAGAVLGGGLLLLHLRRSSAGDRVPVAPEGADDSEEEIIATPLPIVLLFGALYVSFVDLLIQIAAALRIPPAVKLGKKLFELPAEEEEDDFVVGPTHIPFGPYMVVGALLAVFVADPLVHWYLRWAGLA